MSLKNCVICIAGDLKPDIFAPATWEDANIERYCKIRGMALVWEDMNKSVTHLVISRAAFKANHAAVKFVDKDRRGKKKAKIVTYDWLEDSWNARKAIQDVSVYHPGKPRDLDAMVNACKCPKTTKRKEESELDASEEEGPIEAVQITQPSQTESKPLASIFEEPSNKEKQEAAAVGKTWNSVITQSSISMQQATSHNVIFTEKQSIPASCPKIKTQQSFVLEKSKDKMTPAKISGTVVGGLSWEARHKPRVFCDKTDQFKYMVKLTHRKRPGERWVLLLLKAPNVTDKAFLFRAYQYNAKDKIDLKENKSPPATFQTAFELFKTSFRSKMGYPWDERLVRNGNSQLGNWRYTLPAKGEPTGPIPPEFDPGHPKYVKPKDLAPIGLEDQGQSAIERNASKPLSSAAKAHKCKMGGVYLSKARRSSAPISLKRRADEPVGREPQFKMKKIGGEKYKSSEFAVDLDLDDH